MKFFFLLFRIYVLIVKCVPEWREEMRGSRPFSVVTGCPIVLLFLRWTAVEMDGVCGEIGQSSADGKMAFNC